MTTSAGFTHEFVVRLQRSSPPLGGWPRYSFSHPADLATVLSTSTPTALQLGTGASIYTSLLIPAILSAKAEIIFVTCFWAKSKTLSAISQALEKLAAHRQQLIGQGHDLPRLRISICLSSRSFFQKLFHTSSLEGYLYPPSSWPEKLGLPSEARLSSAAIDLTAKSLFFLPFSVMHPKYIIVDRQRAFLPSCNVSWEAWLEGCVEVRGAALSALLTFYARTWDGRFDDSAILPSATFDEGTNLPGLDVKPIPSTAHYVHQFSDVHGNVVPTLILPSPHHRNPQFRPFFWQDTPPPPSTPLNMALLQLFQKASREIFVQTPDVTCAPVVAAMLDATRRGVDVFIVTSRNVKIFEQLLTAGTTTVSCLRSMVRRYKFMRSSRIGRRHQSSPTQLSHEVPLVAQSTTEADLEAQPQRQGRLRIAFFRSRILPEHPAHQEHYEEALEEEPVHTHFKLTIVDGKYTLLGSGNMDRASWYTSQELGLLFDSSQVAEASRMAVDSVLDGRLDVFFDSNFHS